jgi:hypothetical protein
VFSNAVSFTKTVSADQLSSPEPLNCVHAPESVTLRHSTVMFEADGFLPEVSL